ncbi:MAG: LemA family protein [Sphingobacteriia bacterium]|nr:LemA family protein [Sphingobacteriia bacterium]
MNSPISQFFSSGLFRWLAIGVILLVLILWPTGAYNGLVELQEQTDSQWGQVKNAYQRRMDLIPNLVSTVKNYADFEKSTLENVVSARSRVGSIQVDEKMLNDPQKMKAFEEAQGQFTSALSRLMVVAENYPNLKADQQFLNLQSQLEGSENRIAVERNRFNEVVKLYNTKVRTFPGNILAGIFGFEKKAYFEGNANNETAPNVDKLFDK